jgi:hypothetical protein
VLDVTAQSGEVDGDVKSGIEKDTEFYRGYLIDDQCDVAEGRTGRSRGSRKSVSKVAVGSYAVASLGIFPSTAR